MSEEAGLLLQTSPGTGLGLLQQVATMPPHIRAVNCLRTLTRNFDNSGFFIEDAVYESLLEDIQSVVRGVETFAAINDLKTEKIACLEKRLIDTLERLETCEQIVLAMKGALVNTNARHVQTQNPL
jgi:hypothetical protein